MKDVEDELHCLRATEVSAKRVARPQQVCSCYTMVWSHVSLLGQISVHYWVTSLCIEFQTLCIVLKHMCDLKYMHCTMLIYSCWLTDLYMIAFMFRAYNW